jgi:tRNA(fMet)-specific endonuclease VapC
MGTLLDTSVLVSLERTLKSRQRAGAKEHLLSLLGDSQGQPAAIATITASELLHGVHRADPPNRLKRQAFVEFVLRHFPAIPFDLQAARVHAGVRAELQSDGKNVGAHDLIIAATALSLGWQVLTLNPRDFKAVPGLSVLMPAHV